ncbi:MarR family transcriptional regulator [Curtobacterium sp. PhB136]|uniref:MarR family winged helix-turn-helix transcriptional regulator n=1 Tax=Curtobacterium sp. PhB136 TaxID=2485181 RepID=UPI00104E6285|nr:MarR family transcriptional regulator [Curtobacterium sp. PhB136]TCK65824.1 MarR family transcriptional regulator [Curtobacterium sp. PhB136]
MTKVRDHARLDDQLCFALYAASRAVSGAYRQLLREIGLTYPQYLAMISLWERDAPSVAELGAALDLESSTLSPIVRRLEALGLVLRRRSETDERVVHVHVTDAGRALELRAAPVREQVEASTGLSDSAFANLRETLHQLRATVNQAA